ncbi:MAG: ribonuclease HII [Synergistaceae bacterium]|jgi:ribonuclease HII|nr:ribonuclease HII [Synergistaceae bacterium]
MDSKAKLKFLEDFRKRGTVAGTDEAGRGPLAGPVMAAAVVLTDAQEKELLRLGLKDSKLMTPRRREALFLTMCEMGIPWRAQAAGVASIARLNVGRASLWAMEKSIRKLPPPIDLVVVDGLYKIPNLPFEQLPLVTADVLVPVVSAASVVAKVLRDRVMIVLDKLYPSYGFARHKGYPTKVHREAVRTFGLSPVHRASFCKKLMFTSLDAGALNGEFD